MCDLPPGAAASIRAAYPGHVPCGWSDFSTNVRAATESPQIVWGDFTGNARLDLALILRETNRVTLGSRRCWRALVVALHPRFAVGSTNERLYYLHLLGDIPYFTEDSEIYLRLRSPGRVRYFNSRGTRRRALYLDRDGVEEMVGDKPAVVFYWGGDGYRRVVPIR